MAVNLPTSIGNKLDTFSVLRRVFVQKSIDRISSASSQGKDIWNVVTVPICYDATSTLLDRCLLPVDGIDCSWSNPGFSGSSLIRLDCRSVFRVELHEEYIVYLVICNDRKDTIDEENIEDESNDDEGVDDVCSSVDDFLATSMAVFSLYDLRNRSAVRLVDYTEGFDDDRRIGKFGFHPRLPLMAFQRDSEREEIRSIVLWNLSSIFTTHNNVQMNVRFETLSGLGHTRWTEGLHFSACGKYVVVQFYGQKTEILSVETTLLYQVLRSQPEAYYKLPLTAGSRDLDSAVMDSSSYTLSQNQPIFHDGQTSTSLDFAPSSGQTDVNLIKTNHRCSVLQPLIALPALSNIRSSRVTIAPPQDVCETRVRMVLTKSTNLYSTLTDGIVETPTAVIEKDTRALLGAKKRKHGNCQPWESVSPILHRGSQIFQPTINEGRPLKRAALTSSEVTSR